MNTILIVDDERYILKLYEGEFKQEGYAVVTASSGVEALQKLAAHSVDLVILDIRMPELDGIETLKKIMESPSNPPIILNTAYTSYKDNFLTWAAAAYVVKSSDVSELKTKAREVLQARAGPA
jgi:DNA-binding response OmpR family regulator